MIVKEEENPTIDNNAHHKKKKNLQLYVIDVEYGKFIQIRVKRENEKRTKRTSNRC